MLTEPWGSFLKGDPCLLICCILCGQGLSISDLERDAQVSHVLLRKGDVTGRGIDAFDLAGRCSLQDSLTEDTGPAANIEPTAA